MWKSEDGPRIALGDTKRRALVVRDYGNNSIQARWRPSTIGKSAQVEKDAGQRPLGQHFSIWKEFTDSSRLGRKNI